MAKRWSIPGSNALLTGLIREQANVKKIALCWFLQRNVVGNPSKKKKKKKIELYCNILMNKCTPLMFYFLYLTTGESLVSEPKNETQER